MADNYNSKYTGTAVDAAVAKSKIAVTVETGATELTEGCLVVGVTGTAQGGNATKSVKPSSVTETQLVNAISQIGSFNSGGITSATNLGGGVMIIGGANGGSSDKTVKSADSTITEGAVSAAIANAAGYATEGIKTSNGDSLTNGQIPVSTNGNIVDDSGIIASTLSTQNVGVTDQGYIFLRDMPNVKNNSELTFNIKHTLINNEYGVPVIYPGRNFCDATAIANQIVISGLLGTRNVSATLSSGTASYYAPDGSTASFINGSSLSGIASTAKTFTIYTGHKYLMIAKFTLATRVSGQFAFEPSSLGIAENGTTNVLASVQPLEDTDGYFCGFVTPNWTAAVDSKTCYCYIQDGDGTAVSGDSLDSMALIDLTTNGYDAYLLNTSELAFSNSVIYSYYKTDCYTTLILGNTVNSMRLEGPYYSSAMDRVQPLARRLFVRCPEGYYLLIRQYRGGTAAVPTGFIKTTCVGYLANSGYVVSLDSSLPLNQGYIDFIVCKTDGTLVSSPLAADAGFMVEYYPSDDIDKSFVAFSHGINVKTGAALTKTNAVLNSTDGYGNADNITRSLTLSGVDVSTAVIDYQGVASGYTFAATASDHATGVNYISYNVASITEALADADDRIGELEVMVDTKQDTLVSGRNIKTIEGQSLLGSGDIDLDLHLDMLLPIAWSELKALRDAGALIPGRQYRIIDYTCTTITTDTQSAGHRFDIIVTADSASVLNENVRATQHSGDTYFATAKLSAWKLKYCLDNDTTRFAWADSTTPGKGVIYEMEDEWNNEFCYDFKNIQFKRYKVLHDTNYANLSDLDNRYLGFIAGARGLTNDGTDYIWCYSITYEKTIDGVVNYLDGSIHPFDYVIDVDYTQEAGLVDIKVAPTHTRISIDDITTVKVQSLNNIVFQENFDSNSTRPTSCVDIKGECTDMTFLSGCHGLTIGEDCRTLVLGQRCWNVEFATSCYNNTFATSCSNNTFATSCSNNTFATSCYNNAFATSCSNNTFATGCSNNTFATSCSNNTFATGCSNNTFATGCSNNTFATSCYNNTFATSCYNNTFATGCSNNTFATSCYNNTLATLTGSNYIADNSQFITLENGVHYVDITTTSSNVRPIQYVVVHQGVGGSLQDRKVITITRGNTFNTDVKNPDDVVIN